MLDIKEHRVVEILGASEEMGLRLDDETVVRYWGKSVIMKNSDDQYESIVTFETKRKADCLKIGDVFLR